MRHGWRLLILATLSLVGAHAPAFAQQSTTVRVGHFPNITHVQALVARGFERQGRSWFGERLGPGVKIEWYAYNAGPSAMEAIFANSLDLTYVGPNPALNAYARSRGEEVRVVAGAVNGGSALVVQADSSLVEAGRFPGQAHRHAAIRQHAGCGRSRLAGGRRVAHHADRRRCAGGADQPIPISSPCSRASSSTRSGPWSPGSRGSRSEAGGKILVEEKEAITTILVSSAGFLAKNRDLAKRFVAAHRELTEWIRKNPDEAQRLARDELQASFRLDMSPELVARAWSRMVITPDTTREAFQSFVTSAQQVGFLRDTPDLSRLIEAP